MFKENKDVHRIILEKLNDKDLFSVLLINKYTYSLADNHFWMNRYFSNYSFIEIEGEKEEEKGEERSRDSSHGKFDYLCPKNVIQRTPSLREREENWKENWKENYLRVYLYISKLKEDFNITIDRSYIKSLKSFYEEVKKQYALKSIEVFRKLKNDDGSKMSESWDVNENTTLEYIVFKCCIFNNEIAENLVLAGEPKIIWSRENGYLYPKTEPFSTILRKIRNNELYPSEQFGHYVFLASFL
jgi:hypothetical protein